MGLDWLYSLLAPDPNRDYSAMLPLSTDPKSTAVGQDQQFALPGAVREGLLGLLDLTKGTETGKLTGRALEAITLGSLGAGGVLAPKGALTSGGRGIRAYHGSPHDFDRFTFDRIGTGEGAQAYGHGLYFAENEGVARGYRDRLTETLVNKQGAGIPIGDADYQIMQAGQQIGGLSQRELDTISSNMVEAIRMGMSPSDVARRYLTNDQHRPAIEAMLRASGEYSKNPSPGHMYEVDIHADPARFLDWDKPLSGQNELVQRLAKESFTPEAVARDIPGGTAYRGMLGLHDPPDLASSFFREAGIPGIRYLDQGSRTAGAGSSNYVVFPTPEEIVEIRRKYGLQAPLPLAPGAAPPGLLTNRQSDLPMDERVY